MRECDFNNNYPLIDAMFKIRTNSKLFIYDSSFKDNYSVSRGSIILADYRDVQVYVANSSFIHNFGSDGGVFFTHFGSYVEFDSCVFNKNFAISGSIGVI